MRDTSNMPLSLKPRSNSVRDSSGIQGHSPVSEWNRQRVHIQVSHFHVFYVYSTIIWYGVVDYVNFCKGFVGTQDAERGGTPLVSFNHVTDPHFVTFSSSLYATIRNPKPNPKHNPNPNPNRNPSPNPNCNPTVL